MLDRVLDNLVLVFCEGKPAQFIGFEGDLIDRSKNPPDLPVLPVIREEYSKKLEDKERQYHGRDYGKRNQAGYRQKKGSLLRGNPVYKIKTRFSCDRQMFQAPVVLRKNLSERRVLLFRTPAGCEKSGEQQVRDQKAPYFAAEHIPVKFSGDRRHAPLLIVLLIY